jgi:hypothetical protein
MLIRKGKQYPINEVLPKIKFTLTREKSDRVNFDGDMIYMNSETLQTFATDGITCSLCGINGQYFVKEKDRNPRRNSNGAGEYFNMHLYAIDEDGKEILMTKDHTKPKSLSGLNDITNYKTMCLNCNHKKGNK